MGDSTARIQWRGRSRGSSTHRSPSQDRRELWAQNVRGSEGEMPRQMPAYQPQTIPTQLTPEELAKLQEKKLEN